MADVVDLAKRRHAAGIVQLAPRPVTEMAHVGTVGGTRVRVVVQPQGDPGWATSR